MKTLSGLLLAAAALGGCAALAPDRTIQSTMTLAPGQSVSGRFEVPDGGSGYVVFQREAGRKGVEPFPEATTWTSDGKILITFVDAPFPSGEHPLGYASWNIGDGLARRVVVRNTDDRPVTFDWIVRSSSNAIADWDVSGAGR